MEMKQIGSKGKPIVPFHIRVAPHRHQVKKNVSIK
ncbi:hypothetical protein BN2127_JRS1_02216 [Bacillus cereus]|nr:hypothetical protein BN2127_JRS1_02216 [Bacillus cereus]